MSCSASFRQTRSRTSRSPRSSPCTSASSNVSSCDRMGLRERARKSLAAGEAADEADESLVVHVDVARIESEAKRVVEAAQKQLEAARAEIVALRKTKASLAEAGATMQKVEKKISGLETKEDALRKREGEVEALVASLDGRNKGL